ncbi:MAG: ABC transporter ATP-binding protein [Erysipelotrichaceae bacterium]|nr:ABC transporter ATP-binding protein [Erysipelotrichaceae bacterium]
MKHSLIKTCMRCMRRDPLISILLIVLMAAAIFLAVIPPLILARFIDDLTIHQTFTVPTVLLYFGSIAAAGICEAGKNALIADFGQKITHALRTEMSEKLNVLPSSHYVSMASGETVSLFTNDIDTIASLFDEGIISMIVDLGTLISILGVVLVKSKGLFLLLLILLPFLYFVTRVLQKKMYQANMANRRAVAKSTQLIPETIHNILALRIYQKQKWMEDKYDRTIGESFAAVNQANFCDAIYSPIILTTSACAVAVMMCLSAGNETARSFFGMSAGTAVALIAYISSVFAPLESIGMEIQNIQSAAASISRVESFLNLPEKSEQCAIIDRTDNAVDINHIYFRYAPDEKEIFHDYSLHIKQGDMVTFVGRTGAGKSTLFKLILGMYQPEQGSVHIFGQCPYDISEEKKRMVYGAVEQDFRLIHGTIRQQITLDNPAVTDEMVWHALTTAQLKDTVASFPKGLDTICTSEIFSQGQFQLLSIARAIVCDPKLLLLDEITANLDANTEQIVFQALKEASQDRTVISISHRLYQANGGTEIEIS